MTPSEDGDDGLCYSVRKNIAFPIFLRIRTNLLLILEDSHW